MADAATNVLVATLNFITGQRGWTGRLEKKGNRVSGRGATFENDMFGMFTPVGARFEDVFTISTDDSPPEGIIRNGPALEKKHDEEGVLWTPLNSSDPCAKLYRDNPRISHKIRDAEDWDYLDVPSERDMIYVVGNQEEPQIYKNSSTKGNYRKGERKRGTGVVTIAYGELLAGDLRGRDALEVALGRWLAEHAGDFGLEVSLDTNEIARVLDIDGMGAQERMRRMINMWHPLRRFGHFLKNDPDFSTPVPLLFVLLSTETYTKLPQADKDALEPYREDNYLSITDAETDVVVPDTTPDARPYARIRKRVPIKVLRAKKVLAPT